jgi:hypothetical protein
MKNLMTILCALTILILIGLGCSQADTKTADNSNDNKNTNNSSNDNKPTTVSTPKSSDDNLAGSYTITGKNLNNQSYSGDLTIRKQDEVYQFSWNAGGSAYDGVGVREGNLVAVGYGAGDNGKGCGAAIYKIGEKSLNGKLGGWGFNKVGTQNAFLLKEDKKGGIFTVTGTDTDGTDYRGELYVAGSKGDVYHFAFTSGKVSYIGTGIKVGDYFGAGMGVKQCGYIVYDIKDDRLEAAWGVIGNDKLGTEIAERK